MFTNNKFKQLDAVAEMIKGIADADAKVKMQEMRGIIAGHNRMEVPVVEKLDEASTGNAFDTKNNPFKPATKPGETAGFDSKKVSTGTVYQKTYKKEPTQKDEAVDPTVTTTDTLAGRVSGGAPNQHSSFKVKLKAEEMEKEELVGKQHKLDKNKNGKLDSQDFKMLRKEELEELDELSNKTMLSYRTKSIGRDSEFEKQGYKAAGKGPGNEKSDKLFNKADLVATARDSAKNKMLRKEEEELEEAKFDPLKHVKNPSPAVKTAAKAVKRSSYADRVAVMKAGGVKDDRGPRGVTQEEIEQTDEAAAWNPIKHIPKEKQNDAIKTAAKDVKRGSYADRAAMLRAGGVKEEVELDEAKSNYELYHSQYSGAIHHALAHHASKAGLSVHDDDYHHHVSIGPRKPTEGVSVSHSLPATDENGGKHMIHMQIYNRGGDKKPFELNTYSSKIAKTSGRTMKEDTIVEGSGPKEKQKSPYVDRNSAESKAKIQAARDKMAKDKAAEPGKKMLSKMKEDTELDERTLSPAEKDALEVNVKSMKKNLAGFKARYGKDAKSVMYATATKQAKKD